MSSTGSTGPSVNIDVASDSVASDSVASAVVTSSVVVAAVVFSSLFFPHATADNESANAIVSTKNSISNI